MDYSKDISALEQEVTMKEELARILSVNLKKQAKRFLGLSARYAGQKNSDGLLASGQLKNLTFQDIDQYCDLVSKQFGGRVQDLMRVITKIKLDIGTLSNQIKSRPSEDYKERLLALKQRLTKSEDELQLIWKEEHFLVLNYRLDISAKEIQRWTTIMNCNKLPQAKIRESIDNLFK